MRQLVREQYREIRGLLRRRVILGGGGWRGGEKAPEKSVQQRSVGRIRCGRGGCQILGKDVVQEARENDDAPRTIRPEAVRERIPRAGVIDDDQGVRWTGYDVRRGGPVAVHQLANIFGGTRTRPQGILRGRRKRDVTVASF